MPSASLSTSELKRLPKCQTWHDFCHHARKLPTERSLLQTALRENQHRDLWYSKVQRPTEVSTADHDSITAGTSDSDGRGKRMFSSLRLMAKSMSKPVPPFTGLAALKGPKTCHISHLHPLHTLASWSLHTSQNISGLSIHFRVCFHCYTAVWWEGQCCLLWLCPGNDPWSYGVLWEHKISSVRPPAIIGETHAITSPCKCSRSNINTYTLKVSLSCIQRQETTYKQQLRTPWSLAVWVWRYPQFAEKAQIPESSLSVAWSPGQTGKKHPRGSIELVRPAVGLPGRFRDWERLPDVIHHTFKPRQSSGKTSSALPVKALDASSSHFAE